MAKFKIGCHTITWSNFYKDYEIKTVLWEIRKAGYDGVEFFEPLSKLGPTKAIEAQLKEEGLELASLSTNIRISTDEKKDLQVAKEKVIFGSHFGMKALMVTGGWITDGLKKDIRSFRALAKRLDSLADFASKYNIKIAFHNHLDTIVEEDIDILNLLEFTRSTKLCLDTGHLIAVGAEPNEVIERYAASVALVHLKDWDPKLRDFVELGEGVLKKKIENFLETLYRINYTNWIVVELDRTSSTPFESAAISRKFLKGAGF